MKPNNSLMAAVLITKNRAQAVKTFIKKSIGYLTEAGIDLFVYDSSTDNATRAITAKYQKIYPNVHYRHHTGEDDPLSIDKKVLSIYTMYAKDYKWLWLLRDGLTVSHKITQIKKHLQTNYDFIIADSAKRDIRHLGTKIYTNNLQLFQEQVANLNTLGLIIVNSHFILRVIQEVPLSPATYGLWQPIAFFHYYARHTPNVLFLISKIWKPNSAPTANISHFWIQKLCWQWGERWVNMINALPQEYKSCKQGAMIVKTADFEPFSGRTLLAGKQAGGLNFKLVSKYRKYLKQVSRENILFIYLIAVLPVFWAKRIIRLQENFRHFMDKHIYKTI